MASRQSTSSFELDGRKERLQQLRERLGKSYELPHSEPSSELLSAASLSTIELHLSTSERPAGPSLAELLRFASTNSPPSRAMGAPSPFVQAAERLERTTSNDPTSHAAPETPVKEKSHKLPTVPMLALAQSSPTNFASPTFSASTAPPKSKSISAADRVPTPTPTVPEAIPLREAITLQLPKPPSSVGTSSVTTTTNTPSPSRTSTESTTQARAPSPPTLASSTSTSTMSATASDSAPSETSPPRKDSAKSSKGTRSRSTSGSSLAVKRRLSKQLDMPPSLSPPASGAKSKTGSKRRHDADKRRSVLLELDWEQQLPRTESAHSLTAANADAYVDTSVKDPLVDDHAGMMRALVGSSEESLESDIVTPELPLPAGWRALVDPVTMATFYLNEHSHTTSNVHPYYLAWPLESSAYTGVGGHGRVDEVDSTLKDAGWDRYLDHTTNRMFYYNSKTGETTWHRPLPNGRPIGVVAGFTEKPFLGPYGYSQNHVLRAPLPSSAMATLEHALIALPKEATLPLLCPPAPRSAAATPNSGKSGDITDGARWLNDDALDIKTDMAWLPEPTPVAMATSSTGGFPPMTTSTLGFDLFVTYAEECCTSAVPAYTDICVVRPPSPSESTLPWPPHRLHVAVTLRAVSGLPPLSLLRSKDHQELSVTLALWEPMGSGGSQNSETASVPERITDDFEIPFRAPASEPQPLSPASTMQITALFSTLFTNIPAKHNNRSTGLFELRCFLKRKGEAVALARVPMRIVGCSGKSDEATGNNTAAASEQTKRGIAVVGFGVPTDISVPLRFIEGESSIELSICAYETLPPALYFAAPEGTDPAASSSNVGSGGTSLTAVLSRSPNFRYTRSLTSSGFDLLAEDPRNDIYVTVSLDKLIQQASAEGVSLPQRFLIKAAVYGEAGTSIRNTKSVVLGVFPSSRIKSDSFYMTQITLPQTVLMDLKPHILFQFVTTEPKEATWAVPSANMDANASTAVAMMASSSSLSSVIGGEKGGKPKATVFAFAFLMLYPQAGRFQLRSDNEFELYIFKGRPPRPGGPPAKFRCPADLTLSCRERLMEKKCDNLPAYLTSGGTAEPPVLPIGLTVTLRVLAVSIVEDGAIAYLLDDTSDVKVQMTYIMETKGRLLDKTKPFDILKFFPYLLRKIAILYESARGLIASSGGTSAAQTSLFALFSSVLFALADPDAATHPHLRRLFDREVTGGIFPPDFLRDVVDHLFSRLERFLRAGSTKERVDLFGFPSLAFGLCLLLGSLLRRPPNDGGFDAKYFSEKFTHLLRVFSHIAGIREEVQVAIRAKRCVLQALCVLHPALLGVMQAPAVVEHYSGLLAVLAGSNEMHGQLLAFLVHLFQHDPHTTPAVRANELYIQCSLLPKACSVLNFVLSMDNGTTVQPASARIQQPLLLRAAVRLASCLFLSFFPSIFYHSGSNKTINKSLWGVAFPELLSTCAALLYNIVPSLLSLITRDYNATSSASPPTDLRSSTAANRVSEPPTDLGPLYLCIASYFAICCDNNGRLLRDVVSTQTPSVRTTGDHLAQLFAVFGKALHSGPMALPVNHGFHRLIMRLLSDYLSVAGYVASLFMGALSPAFDTPALADVLFAHFYGFVVRTLDYNPAALLTSSAASAAQSAAGVDPSLLSRSLSLSTALQHVRQQVLHLLYALSVRRSCRISKFLEPLLSPLLRLFTSLSTARTPLDGVAILKALAIQCIVCMMVADFVENGAFVAVRRAVLSHLMEISQNMADEEAAAAATDALTSALERCLANPVELVRHPIAAATTIAEAVAVGGQPIASPASSAAETEQKASKLNAAALFATHRLLNEVRRLAGELAFLRGQTDATKARANTDAVVQSLVAVTRACIEASDQRAVDYVDLLVQFYKELGGGYEHELAYALAMRVKCLQFHYISFGEARPIPVAKSSKLLTILNNQHVLPHTEEDVAQLHEALVLFCRCGDWQAANTICENLAEFFCVIDKYSASRYYEISAHLCRRIAEPPPSFGVPICYYAARFVGTRLDTRLDGHIFIYRTLPTEGFASVVQRVKASVPAGITLNIYLASDRLPALKPEAAVQLFQVFPEVELERYHDNCLQGDGGDDSNVERAHLFQIKAFYCYVHSDVAEAAAMLSKGPNSSHITASPLSGPTIDREKIRTAQIWNDYHSPAYFFDADPSSGAVAGAPVPVALKESDLPPQEPPCFRMRWEVDDPLPGVIRRAVVSREFATPIPAAQACIEWADVCYRKLTFLCDALSDNRLVAAARRGKLYDDPLLDKAILELSMSIADGGVEKASTALAHSHREQLNPPNVLRTYLTEILQPESEAVTGLRKMLVILDRHEVRVWKTLVRVKQDIAKGWVKEQKRCKELGMDPPPKPNYNLLKMVQEPIIARLTARRKKLLATVRRGLDLLKKEHPVGTEAECEALEVMFKEVSREVVIPKDN